MPSTSDQVPEIAENSPPLVSVVVLNYNKRDDLHRNLARLREMTYPNYEVIVVDNCSTDDSATMVRDMFPEVQLIESSTNGGVSQGRNLGFRAARGEFVIYLDDDSLAPVDVCEKTVELFGQDPQAGCLAYRVRQMPIAQQANPFSNTYLANYHGAGHAFRRHVLESIGYLDENFFFGGEEIDSSFALFELGYKVRNTPEILVDHYVRVHHGKDLTRRLSNGMASIGWFYVKHFPLHLAVLFTTRAIVAATGTAIRRRAILPVFKGLGLFISGAPRILRVRRRASPEAIRFYTSPDVQPPHHVQPLHRKLVNKLRAG